MDWRHSLAAGIVSLAHSLDLIVVAEGVEIEKQAQILDHLRAAADLR